MCREPVVHPTNVVGGPPPHRSAPAGAHARPRNPAHLGQLLSNAPTRTCQRSHPDAALTLGASCLGAPNCSAALP